MGPSYSTKSGGPQSDDLTEKATENFEVPEAIQARWQRILALIAEILGLPTVLINRIDPPTLETFLASAGAENPFRKGERFDLLGLYCEKVIKERAPLLVSDAAKDPEWVDSQGAKSGLTFYIGYPIIWPDGQIFGTICALDQKENPGAVQHQSLISEFQQGINTDLKLIIEAHKREELIAELRQSRDHLRRMVAQKTSLLKTSDAALVEAQRIAQLGSWEWEIISGNLQWSEEVYRILGLSPGKIDPTYEAFLALVHPDDRQDVKRSMEKCLSHVGNSFSVAHRVIRTDGTEIFVQGRGKVTFGEEGKPICVIGTLQDITEQKLAEEGLLKAMDQIKKLKDQLETENIFLREEMGLRDGFKEIIGDSDLLRYVFYRTQQVAKTDAIVLLMGETGTGKGRFARSLHESSDRRDRPFVTVNCAALPATLIESELFGREKGAFTGSTARQIGRFELADGGTIFLDEIGELPLELQPKLLKVIETGEFERLGSPHAVKADVRIIASTNRNLEQEIEKGHFRADLFYRLNVFPITVPPIRERREDIPLLISYFVEKYSRRYGKNIKNISKTHSKALQSYDWPGNVRELMNVIERAVILSNGSRLRIDERFGLFAGTQLEVRKQTGPSELSEVQREHILKTLSETEWRIEGNKGAAKLLGMHSSTLRARMKKLGIKRPASRQPIGAQPRKKPNQI